MKHPSVRRRLWNFSKLFAALCLLGPPLLALVNLIFPARIRNPYTAVNCWGIDEDMNTALANMASILGTGAALTLLATAADRKIGEVTARDILKKEYPGLLYSYGAFFVLVFFASFAGDCCLSAVAILSTLGATVLSIWFFTLSLILLLDTEKQQNMVFSYYEGAMADPKITENQCMYFLRESVVSAKAAPLCWDGLNRVFQAAISLFSTGDETSKSAAACDQWSEVQMLTGVEMMEAAWSTLWQAGASKDGFSRLQADMICRNILTASSWRKANFDRAILLAGLASAWLPWEEGRTYTDACAELDSFCAVQRAENKGDSWSEQVISELACAFGMGMAISLANQDKPAWVNEEDLETAWERFADVFRSAVFSVIDNSDRSSRAELEILLEYVEWISRKRLGISWTQYRSDRRNLITGKDLSAGVAAAKKLTNICLLDTLTSKYIRGRTGG